MKRKGQSRLWYKDNLWWISVVEFQPSSWSKGSYLNVAAMWLWNAKNYWSFDDGGRVEAFHQFKDSDQFTVVADALAKRASVEVVALSERFHSLHTVASHLAGKSDENPWSSFHAAMAAMACDDMSGAQLRFKAVLSAKEHAPWVSDLKTRVIEIIQKVADTGAPSAVIAREIQQARVLLKLAPVDSASLWTTAR